MKEKARAIGVPLGGTCERRWRRGGASTSGKIESLSAVLLCVEEHRDALEASLAAEEEMLYEVMTLQRDTLDPEP